MIRYLKTALFAAATLLSASCIRNDIPYPVVEISITGIEGEGFSLSEIDLANRTITLTLDEQTDIREVNIQKVTYDVTVHSVQLDKEALIDQIRSSEPLVGTFDMRSPIYTTLSIYQDYAWTIRAEQPIAREFKVSGQIGSTVFDTKNRVATAYVAKTADLTNVAVTALKLGPEEITTYSPSLDELTGTSFESVRFVDISYHGQSERWLLYVLHTDKVVELKAYAWSRVIWLYGEGIEGTDMGFHYRKEGDTDWIDVTPTISGGNFEASIAAEAETKYEIKAYCETEETPEGVFFETQAVVQVPNSSFEEWSTVNDIVYPYTDKADAYWGTGNPGAKIGGETLTQSCPPRPGGTGVGANLRSKFVNIVGLGKFAAGNLFVGDYVATKGTNGILTFGRPFKQRPTALKVWVKYTCGKIDRIDKIPVGGDLKKDDPDNGIVYIALGTWTPEEYGKDSQGEMRGTQNSPLCVDTRSVTTFFKPNSKDVVGYGEYVMAANVDEWTQVTIPIAYPDKSIEPTHLMIVCSASRWGDYFTGSTKSEMWVDDFELIYDPLPGQ